MQIIIRTYIIVAGFFIVSFAQDISTTFNMGSFLYHADNELQITRDKNISRANGFSVDAEFEIFWDLKCSVGLGFISGEANRTIQIMTIDTNSSRLRFGYGDLIHNSVILDLSIIPYSNSYFDIILGPSMAFTKRHFKVEFKDLNLTLLDKLYSTGFGYHFKVRLRLDTFRDLPQLKFVMLYAFRFIDASSMDLRGRAVGNYSLDFNQRILSFGFMYQL